MAKKNALTTQRRTYLKATKAASSVSSQPKSSPVQSPVDEPVSLSHLGEAPIAWSLWGLGLHLKISR